MKKSNVKNLALVSFMTFVGLSFAACSSSDDGEGGSASGNPDAGVVEVGAEKYRVLKAGNVSYDYDSNGKLVSFGNQYNKYDVTYNPFKITSTDGTSSDVMSNISVNGKGYVTGFKEAYTYSYNDNSSKSEGNVSVSYDGKGHVTRIKGSGSGVEIYDGEKETYKTSFEYVYTWKDNKLMKIVETESDGGDKCVTTYEYIYSGNPFLNLSCQYVPNILCDYDWAIGQGFACIGYLGKGPTALPDGCEYSYVEDGHKSTGSGTYAYTLQNNGLVSKYIVKNNYGTSNTGYMEYESVGINKSKAAKTVNVAAHKDNSGAGLFHGIHKKFKNRH